MGRETAGGEAMSAVDQALKSRSGRQFSLWSLLEYMTLCSVLLAFVPVVGTAATSALILLALALWARQGFVALAMLMAASLAADWSHRSLHSASTAGPQVVVLLLAAALCLGYRLRRRWRDEKGREYGDSRVSST